jgi:hypothetical protein
MFTTAQIEAKLAAGEIPPETLACPEGGSRWQPLATLPALRRERSFVPTPLLELPPPSAADAIVSNPLPRGTRPTQG